MSTVPVEGLLIRPVTTEEHRAYLTAVGRQFGEDVSDEDVAAYRDLIEYDRTLAAFDGDRIVGTTAAISFSMAVPGGAAVSCAGVTAVGVASTHRRRGLLTAMMRRQLDDIAGRGEPVAALYASESPIYGRFGYGAAAPTVEFEIESAWAQLSHPPAAGGPIRLVSTDEAHDVLPGIYARAHPQHPGMMDRSAASWAHILGYDPEHARGGFSSLFRAVLDDRGYVLYRMDNTWRRGVPDKTLKVEELITTDDEALAALWQYCLSIDLVARVRAGARPPDDPLPSLLHNRARAWITPSELLYVRLVDVGAALTARSYTRPDSLVFDVTDAFCPANSGRWRLDAGPDGARCSRTDADAELSLDVRELGACYLGGVRFRSLARAGLVTEHRPDALRRADALFDTDRLPWNPREF